MIWVSYSLISMVFQEHTNENHDYIPTDASLVVRIDGSKLIKSSISSVLLTEDEEIIDMLQKTYKDQHDTKLRSIGVAINSDLIIFNQAENDHNLVGILFNLTSPRLFKKNIGRFLDDDQAYATNENVGLVYIELDNPEIKELSHESLQKKANKILKQKSDFNFELLESDKENVMAQTWSQPSPDGGTNIKNGSNLSFIITDYKLVIDGELALDSQPKDALNKEIKPSGIHISTDQISGLINDTLVSFLSDLNLPSSKISGFSLNYHGLELIVEPVFFAAPKFDALITFEDALSMETMIDSLMTSDDMQRIEGNSIQYKGLILYYKQMDSKSICIGTSKNIEFIDREEDLAFHMTGSPSLLTKIKGGGMMLSFFEMIPAYTASRDFTQRAKHIDIQITRPKNGTSKLHGEIEFKKDQYALNSVLKLMITTR